MSFESWLANLSSPAFRTIIFAAEWSEWWFEKLLSLCVNFYPFASRKRENAVPKLPRKEAGKARIRGKYYSGRRIVREVDLCKRK